MTTNIELVVDELENIDLGFEGGDAFDLDFDSAVVVVNGGSGEPYAGSYTVTPSNQTQTLPTIGKLMSGNITINPIPSNYGLITWNGSTLVVS